MASDDKVIIGLSHGLDDAESVLISYLMGVEALRKGKQVLLWLTKDGVHVAAEGFAAKVNVPDALVVAELHEEYISSGGQFYACPVCVKTRGLHDATLVKGAEVKGGAVGVRSSPREAPSRSTTEQRPTSTRPMPRAEASPARHRIHAIPLRWLNDHPAPTTKDLGAAG